MRRPTPSMVVSLIALFVALGGTGYAAFKLPKNSVHSRQIAKGAVKSSDVANGTLAAKDFKDAPKGPKGDPGSALAFARVNSDGKILDGSGLTFTGRGTKGAVYCFDRTGGGVRNVIVSVDAGSDEGAVDPQPIQLAVTQSAKRLGETGCPDGSDFFVTADKVDGTRIVPAAFYVAVIA